MAVKTKAPTGLTISRSGNSFNCSWKCGDKNYSNGQSFRYALTGMKRPAWLAVGAGVRSKAVTINANNYYPKTSKYLKTVKFEVRGNCGRYKKKKKWRDPTVSSWAGKAMTLTVPARPTVTEKLDDTLSSTTVFSWETTISDTGTAWFTDVEWESMLVKDNNETNGSKLAWSSSALGYQTGTGGASGSKEITESTGITALASFTRWFRVRSRGPAGASAWTYIKHVYAKPNGAVITKAEATPQQNGYLAEVYWTLALPNARPVDKTIVQYQIATPADMLTRPEENSWVDANVSRDIRYDAENSNSAALFNVDGLMGLDKCLFIRVNTQHDTEANTTLGDPALAYIGRLTAPKSLSVTLNHTNYKATITATNESAVEDSFMVVRYIPASDPEGFVVGVMTESGSVTVQCPDWSHETGYRFEVYTAVGTYSETVRADGVSSYEVNALMVSDSVNNGGVVPLPPENVSVSATSIPGTARVVWDWTWAEATGAEISWADHEDAWESTDEPEVYEVGAVNASAWNISGLETGVTWYIRVRLVQKVGDTEVASAWSDMRSISLASAPSIPVLTLSAGVITADGSVTASWVYSTTDGTAQSHATIAELTYDNGEPVYTKLAETETEQHITISAEVAGWQTGESHSLVVQVMSASGRLSDGWSDPVAVIVADPLTADITETSLINADIEVNPRTFTGNPIQFTTDLEETVTDMEVTLDPIQDLHGYDKPWVGGAGKNKLKINAKTTTVNGVTFTINSDGSVRVQGTTTANNTFLNLNYVNSTTLAVPVGTWKIGCKGGAIDGVRFQINSSSVYVGQATSEAFSTVTIPSNATNSWARLQIQTSGTDVDVTVYPMICESTETDTTFAPYENIAPISGSTSVEANVVGKNLLDFENVLNSWGSTYTKDGDVYTVTTTGQGYGRPYQFSDEDVTVSARAIIKNLEGAVRWRLDFLDKSGNVTATLQEGTPVLENFKACKTRLNYGVGAGGAQYSDVQIELGSTATDYEPYQGDTYTSNLGRTVYGGTVDLVSGVLTVDRAMVDLGSLTWYKVTGNAYANWSTTGVSDINFVANEANYISSCYKAYSNNAATAKEDSYIWVNKENRIRIKDLGKESLTAEQFKATLSGQQFVYELATPQTCQLTPQSITTLVGVNNVWGDGDIKMMVAEYFEDNANVLDKMPLTVTVTGADVGDTTSLIIERSADFQIEQPNEKTLNGYEGEAIVVQSMNGSGTFTIDETDLIGRFNDGASYRIFATVQDGLGQSATADPIDFVVRWEHQALIPNGEVSADIDHMVTIIKPVAPAGTEDGDTCDIYRLSVDRPALIYEGAKFGEQYVDPFPTIGENGGHRIVFKSKDGDYITADETMAWTDFGEDDGDFLPNGSTIIDFGTGRVNLDYDLDLSSDWAKDVEVTNYLGGSVQGDWNPAINRSGKVSAIVPLADVDTIEGLRRLADYPGICHIRTNEGSSYPADIQVSESINKDSGHKVASFDISITKVDPEALDGLTYAEWLATQQEEA